jgi:two-component system response regulator BaeR
MNTPSIARVLVVEDDRKISALLMNYLRAENYDAIPVYDGQDAVELVSQLQPDAVILDWMLPNLNGIDICKTIRLKSDVPILMLTARIDELDRLIGLDSGADDYVCKPFAPREIVARVRALLRRANGNVKTSKSIWQIDEQGFRISWLGHWLPLTRIEFLIFRLLLSRPSRVFSRDQMLALLFDNQRDINDRSIDTHIKNLRKKIQMIDAENNCIVSVYGVGYRFDVPE